MRSGDCCAAGFQLAHVRFGSGVDITAYLAMSALPPKADIERRDCNVRFVPIATECTAAKAASLFDHLIGEGEQRGWHGEPEYSGGLCVDDQFKLADLHGPHCPR